MKKLIFSMVFLSCMYASMYVNTVYAQYDQSLAPPGYVLMQCEWNYGTQWFMKVYYWPAANHWIYRFHFFCEFLGTNIRDIDGGVGDCCAESGGYAPGSNDQYGGDPGAQATADENFGGSDIGQGNDGFDTDNGEAGCCSSDTNVD